MVEINIYTKFNYKRIKKNANILFNKRNKWYTSKTVFAPYNGKYLVSIRKKNIRICYWNEFSEEGAQIKETIKNFIKDNFSNQIVGIKISGECDIFDEIETIKL